MVKKVKRILSLRVKNIRGIQDRTFKFNNLTKNTPNLMVAPNGFGKSSITEAFSSLRPKGGYNFEAEEKYYNHDATLDVCLTLEVQFEDGGKECFSCNKADNKIGKVFDTCVINSVVIPDAKIKHTPYKAHANPFWGTKEIVLVRSIPKSASLNYSFTSRKKRFLGASSLFKNISNLLIKRPEFVVDFYRAVSAYNVNTIKLGNEIDTFLADNKDLSGRHAEKREMFTHSSISSSQNKAVASIKVCLRKHLENWEDLYWMNVVDLIVLFRADKANFKKYYEYQLYLHRKKTSEDLLLSFSPEWKTIKPTKSGGKLVLKLPMANHMSKGEGDLLAFLGQLTSFRFNGFKHNTILAMDEILDYLDDSNLLAIQFYLTEIINDWKSQGKNLFLLVFTHLDPLYFKQFSFKKQNVHYLKEVSPAPSNTVKKIVYGRKNDDLEEVLAKYFFHYHYETKDAVYLFEKYELDVGYSNTATFYQKCQAELQRYVEDEAYDPILLCCSIRHNIELYLYSRLQKEKKAMFIKNIHGTEKKIRFCEDLVTDIPDAFYLLKPVYNSALHLSPKFDRLTPIVLKLENLIVKNLIKNMVKFTKGDLT